MGISIITIHRTTSKITDVKDLDVYDPLIVTFLMFLPVLNHLLPLELFVYLRLIIGILSLCTSAHLTLLSLFNPALNLTFSLLPITSSHPHASASDSTFDFWRYINIWLTLTLQLHIYTMSTTTLFKPRYHFLDRAVPVMISRKSVSICNHSHTIRANSRKIISYRGTPLWCPSSRGISSPSGTKFAHKKLETLGYHVLKTLSHLSLKRYRVVTDRKLDRITIANTHVAVPAVMRKNRHRTNLRSISFVRR